MFLVPCAPAIRVFDALMLRLGKENVFWGARGLGEFGGKVLVRDRLGVVAQAAASAAPPLVTAAAPRDLRIDPCERKSKRDELRRVGQRSVGGRGSRWHGRSTFYSGNAAAKFAKISFFT